MDRMLIILKKENGPRASGPCTGVKYHTIQICLLVYEAVSQVSVYRTIGPLVGMPLLFSFFFSYL